MKRKLSLKNYILTQMLALFTFVSAIIMIYNYATKKTNLIEFSNSYLYEYSDNITKKLSDITYSSLRATGILSAWLKDKKSFEHKDVKSFPTYESVLSRKPTEQEVSYLQRLISSFESLVTLQIANSAGSFWQIRQYNGIVNLPVEKIVNNSKEHDIPINTAFVFRNYWNHNKDGETWTYYADDGTLINSNQVLSDYIAVQREWYLNARPDRYNPFISDIYNKGSTVEVPVITVSSELTRELNATDEKCVVSADVSSLYIRNALKNSSASDGDMIFILDEDNNIVLGSHDQIEFSEIKDEKTYERSDAFARAMLSYRNVKNDQESFFFNSGDLNYVGSIANFPDQFEIKTGKRWKVLIITPTATLEKAFDNYKDSSNIIYAIIMLVVLIQIITISDRLSDPISELTDEAMRIYKFDFSSSFTADSKVREIEKLDDVISKMRISLSSFTRYIPKSLVVKLLNKSSNVELGGEFKQVAIYFSDIENFTTISEGLKPTELTTHISDYFDHLTTILINQNATIDKYIGDSIMAFWGAPDDDDKKAFNACRGALLCQNELQRQNEIWKEKGMPALNTRMGIHMGEVIVGNIGSSERINYTIIGDAVNLASRLEGTNKIYKTKIIISQTVYEDVYREFLAMPLDIVAVKGKNKPIKIYELIGQFDDPDIAPSNDDINFSKAFARAFNFYINRNWCDSLKILNELEDNEKHKLLIDMYKSRCESFIQAPPDPSWDGTFKLTSK